MKRGRNFIILPFMFIALAAMAYSAPCANGQAPAANPNDAARSLPEDSMFYFQVRGLSGIVDSAIKARALELFTNTGLSRELGFTDKVAEWQKMREDLRPELGFDPWPRMIDALGGKWGVAAWLDGEEAVDGVMFARSSTPGTAEQLMRAYWENDQRNGDQLRIVEEAVGASRLVSVAKERREDEPGWYVFGPEVALAGGRKELLDRALMAAEGNIGNLGAEKRFARAIQTLGGGEFFAWADVGRFIDLNIIDIDLPEPTTPFFTMLREGAVDDWAMGARLVPGGLNADFLLRMRPDRISAPLMGLIESPTPGNSGIWRLLPPSDIAVQVTSRMPVAKRIEAVRWTLDAESRANFDNTLFRISQILGGMRPSDFLARLGPETTVAVLKPRPGERGFPETIVFIQLAPDPAFRRGLHRSLNTVLSLLTAITLRQTQVEGEGISVELRNFTYGGVSFSALSFAGGNLPQGLNPCYGIVGDYLVVTSSGRTMARLIDSSTRQNPGIIPGILLEARNHADLVFVDVEPAMAALGRLMESIGPMFGEEDKAILEEINLWISMLREGFAPVRRLVAHTSYTREIARMTVKAEADWREWERFRAAEGAQPPALPALLATKE